MNQVNFSVAGRIYKVHDIDEALFFLALVMITENVPFSSFHSNNENNSFIKSCSLSIQTIPEKMESNRERRLKKLF